ncbi:hypothetical protein GCM10027068_48440 [Prescottella soli]
MSRSCVRFWLKSFAGQRFDHQREIVRRQVVPGSIGVPGCRWMALHRHGARSFPGAHSAPRAAVPAVRPESRDELTVLVTMPAQNTVR